VNSENPFRLQLHAADLAFILALQGVDVIDVRVKIGFSREHFIAMLTLVRWALDDGNVEIVQVIKD
jgi:hypothetical protein